MTSMRSAMPLRMQSILYAEIQGRIERLQALVGVAEHRIGAIIDGGSFGLGREHLARLDRTGDALPILEQADADARHIGGAQAGAGMTPQPLNRAAEHIGADLQPEVAGGAAVTGDDAAHLGAPL